MAPGTKKNLAVIVAICTVLVSVEAIMVYRQEMKKMLATGTSCNLGEVREAFNSFREEHRRWPISMDEIYGDKYFLEGTLTPENCIDQIANAPFQCVTDKNLFIKIGEGDLRQVLVVSPKPFNDASWPKTRLRIYALDSLGGISKISPSELNNAHGSDYGT